MFGAGNSILTRCQMTVMAVGLCTCASSIKVFGRERIVYWREAAGLAQLEPCHLRIEIVLALAVDHLERPLHAAEGRAQGTPRRVLEALARLESGLGADDAGAPHQFPRVPSIGYAVEGLAEAFLRGVAAGRTDLLADTKRLWADAAEIWGACRREERAEHARTVLETLG